MTRISASLALAPVLAVAACASPDTAPVVDVCRSTSSPAEVVLPAGGRATLDRSAFTSDEEATFEAVGDVRVFDDAGNAGRIVVRARYEQGDAAVRVTCASGESFDVPVRTEAITFDNVATWSGDAGPIGREYFAMWQDRSVTTRLWVYGGYVYQPMQFTPNAELWSFDLQTATWTPFGVLENAPLLPGARIAPGSAEDTYYLLGGLGDPDTPHSLRALNVGASPPVWSSAPFSGTAPESYTGAWIRDEPRNRWLSLCGASSTLGINCAVNTYSETDGWASLPLVEGSRAPRRFGFAYAYDQLNDRIVVFSGQDGADNLDIATDTWALELGEEPARWVRLFESDEHAIARRNSAFAYDSTHHRLFVWGGTPDGVDSVPGMQVLHLDRGHEEWLSFDTPSTMPSRTSGAGVFDPTTNSIYWGFGNDDAIYTDLYRMRL